jgi:hypothetical protein
VSDLPEAPREAKAAVSRIFDAFADEAGERIKIRDR